MKTYTETKWIKKIIKFTIELKKEILQDDLLSIANGLTYRLLLSLFPLIVFLISIIAFLELDPSTFLKNIPKELPEELLRIIESTTNEITLNKHPSLLSGSLIVATWNASTGFQSLIKGINKTYGQKDKRSFIRRRIISIAFVILFSITIILSLTMFIFREHLLQILQLYMPFMNSIKNIHEIIGYSIALCIILFTVMWMNKVAIAKPVRFKSILPGSITTVIVWVVASKIFSIYVNNFSNYANIYGGIAGIMILMIWLNIICIILLVGSEINALIEK